MQGARRTEELAHPKGPGALARMAVPRSSVEERARGSRIPALLGQKPTVQPAIPAVKLVPLLMPHGASRRYLVW